jgi:hypothetical protein
MGLPGVAVCGRGADHQRALRENGGKVWSARECVVRCCVWFMTPLHALRLSEQSIFHRHTFCAQGAVFMLPFV